MRTIRSTVVFHNSFKLKGIDAVQSQGKYLVETDEIIVGGLDRPIYQRIATLMHVRASGDGYAMEVVEVDPKELATALSDDRNANRPREFAV